MTEPGLYRVMALNSREFGSGVLAIRWVGTVVHITHTDGMGTRFGQMVTRGPNLPPDEIVADEVIFTESWVLAPLLYIPPEFATVEQAQRWLDEAQS